MIESTTPPSVPDNDAARPQRPVFASVRSFLAWITLIPSTNAFFVTAWLTLTAVYTWPLVSSEFLPLMDGPTHMAIISIWQHVHDGGIMSAFYEPRQSSALITPYFLHYGLLRALATFMPIELANRLIVGLYAVSLPASLAYLLTRFGKDKRYALLSFPLIYNRAFTYGFLANSLAIPVLLLTLSALKSYLDRPTIRRELLLASSLFLLYCSHILVFSTFAIIGPVIFFAHVHRPKQILRRSLFVWPTVAIALQWARTAAGGGGGNREHIKGQFLSITSNIHQFFQWSTDVLVKQSDEVVLLVVIGTWLGLQLIPADRDAKRKAKSWSLPLAGLMLLLGYFLMPANMIRPDHWATNARWIVPAFLLLLSLPQARLDNRYAWLLVPSLGVILWGGLQLNQAVKTFNQQMAPLDEVLRFIPPNQRVLPLTYDENDGVFDTHSLRAQLLLYQVRKAGVIPYGYTGPQQPQMPVRLKTTMPAPNWKTPWRFNYARQGKSYDYFLVLESKGKKPKATFPGAGNHVKLLVKRGRFSAYNNLK